MFSKNWEKTYRQKKQIVHWPWSDLITLISRYVLKKHKIKNVLEVGSGTGPNIPFFIEKNIDYYGIEGSKSAVKIIKKKFPKIKNKVLVGDFTKKIPFKKKFDLIVDRGSLTHNKPKKITQTFEIFKKIVKKNGFIICIDWFSTKDFAWKNFKGKKESNTISNIKKGDLKNVGTTHFSNLRFIQKISKKWKLIYCEEKIKKSIFPKNKEQRATWSFVIQNKQR